MIVDSCGPGSSVKSKRDLKTISQQCFWLSKDFYIALKHPYHKPPRPINLRQGLCRATLQVLRLEPGALLTAGLPCHSFVFLNRSTSKRSRSRPLGDNKKEYIFVANMPLGFIIIWKYARTTSTLICIFIYIYIISLYLGWRHDCAYCACWRLWDLPCFLWSNRGHPLFNTFHIFDSCKRSWESTCQWPYTACLGLSGIN